MLKLCQYFGATKTDMGKIFGIWISFIWKGKVSYRYYQEKVKLAPIFIHKSYNEIVDKIIK